MPRRQPRAVYEVYDAEIALGERDEESAGVAAEPAEAGSQAADMAGDMAAEPSAEPAEAARAPMPPMPPMPPTSPGRSRSTGRAFGRALTGAMLCVVAVCVIAAVSIVLLHLLSGPSAAGPRTAQLGGGPYSRTGSQAPRSSLPAARRRSVREPSVRSATSSRTGSRPRASVAPRRGPGQRRHATGPSVRAGQPPAGTAAGAPRAAAADRRQTVPPPQASGLQREEAAVAYSPSFPGTVSACACAPAEVEFGFER
jgi:hypothetical protein